MLYARFTLLVPLALWSGVACAGCDDDQAVMSAPDVGGGGANTGDAASSGDAKVGGDAKVAFDNQDSSLSGPSCAPARPGSRPLWACAQRDGASTIGSPVAFHGEVEEIIEEPWECLGGWGAGSVPGTTRFRVADGSAALWVGWTLPKNLIGLGDVVSGEYRSDLGVHAISGHLVVRRADGSLLAWLAQDGSDGLEPPTGIKVERDGDPCRDATDCGVVELDGLEVEVFSERARVPYGASVELGDYVAQGSSRLLTESTCPEEQSGSTQIAVYSRTDTRVDADAGAPR